MNNQISVVPLYEGALQHSGIKGQRWGVMHGPPYPLARGKGGRLPAVKKVTSEAKQRRLENAAEKKESRAEDKKEQLRKYIVEHPKALYKHKEMFTRDELEDILKEIDFDQKLKDVRRGQLKKTVDTAKDIATGVIAAKNIAAGAVDLYKAGRDINSILKGNGTFSESQERKKAAEAAKKESESKPKTENASKESSSSPSSESKPKTENASKESSSKSSSESKKSNPMKSEIGSPEERNSKGDTNFGNVSNYDSLITSIKPTTESAYRRKQFVARGEAFLERIGSATPSTYYTPSQGSQSNRRRNQVDNRYSSSSYRN